MGSRFRLAASLLVFLSVGSPAFGQGYGTDLQNVMTPAAGGMAGVSIARPQDVPAAIFGNPASLTQFCGTQFTLGGGWVEGYPTVTNDGTLNQINGQPFSATSRTVGSLATEIGITQDLSSLGVPGTFGVGLAGLSGGGAEYRGMVPENDVLNNLSSDLLVLGVNLGAGLQVTDKLSLGAALTLGDGFEQMPLVGPFVGSALVEAYALRGTVGANYDLNECNTVGAYYQSKMHFVYPEAVRVGNDYTDIRMDQPETIGFGFANRSLMNGKLLIAADVYYKLWQNADLYQDVFVNQWAFAIGAQLTRGRMKFRGGYAYDTNPLNHNVGASLDGYPIVQAQLQLFQAASMAVIGQQRISGGIGYQDFMFPGVDLDLFAGGFFPASDTLGSTQVSVASYYVGMGLTWRYGACCCHGDSDASGGQASNGE